MLQHEALDKVFTHIKDAVPDQNRILCRQIVIEHNILAGTIEHEVYTYSIESKGFSKIPSIGEK